MMIPEALIYICQALLLIMLGGAIFISLVRVMFSEPVTRFFLMLRDFARGK